MLSVTCASGVVSVMSGTWLHESTGLSVGGNDSPVPKLSTSCTRSADAHVPHRQHCIHVMMLILSLALRHDDTARAVSNSKHRGMVYNAPHLQLELSLLQQSPPASATDCADAVLLPHWLPCLPLPLLVPLIHLLPPVSNKNIGGLKLSRMTFR